MAESYAGPSRFDLLVLVHKYNIVEDHKAKIIITETVVDTSELFLVQTRTESVEKPKNQTQTDIDNSMKQLWDFKKHVDGFKELRSKDWERIVWATNTLRFLVTYCRGKSMEEKSAKNKTKRANATPVSQNSWGLSKVKQETSINKAVPHINTAPLHQHNSNPDIAHDKSSHDPEPGAAPTCTEQRIMAGDCHLAKKDILTRKESVTFSNETRTQVENQATSTSEQKPRQKKFSRAPKDVSKLKARSTAKAQEQKAAEAHELAKKLASEVRKF